MSVVLIEDDSEVLESMTLLLEGVGYHVIPCLCRSGDCAELAALTDNRLNRPDVIVTDYRLSSGLTGIEVAAKLRQAFSSDIPAILITGELTEAGYAAAIANQFRILHKPFRIRELRQEIVAMVGEEGPGLAA